MVVRPPAWNYAPTGRIFMKFEIWAFFEKYAQKIQVPLKSDKNNWYFTWRPTYIFDLVQFVSEWKMFHTNVVEKIKTNIFGQ